MRHESGGLLEMSEERPIQDGVKNDSGADTAPVARAAASATAGQPRPELPNAYEPPANVLQEVLTTLWSELLRIEGIGIDDDFFELGGDSVLATQIVSRLRAMFRMDLPLIVLFEAPTVSSLAAYMIANETRPGVAEKTAAVLKKIQGMTEDEVTRSLSSK